RRGKRHKAQCGSVNVLGGAPYGYRYITKNDGAGIARYEIAEREAAVVRKIFTWVGEDRLSIGDVKRHLENEGIPSPRGKTWWDRTTIWGILKNPAYEGKAAFGKTRVGPLRPRIKACRGGSLQPRVPHSVYDVPQDEWLTIPVPSLVDENLFTAVQAQLDENRRCSRTGKRGARYLLQGLISCACCHYAYYGKAVSSSARKGHTRNYAYYRCIGSDAYRFGGQRLCSNTQVRTDRLEEAVWSSVCDLVREPQMVHAEYQRRLSDLQSAPKSDGLNTVEKQIAGLKRSIERLIDGYAEGYIDKSEGRIEAATNVWRFFQTCLK
ncbi:MAG: recombinase family protein, partial [Candidatus Thiodiazotropha sp. 6PLUC6]